MTRTRPHDSEPSFAAYTWDVASDRIEWEEGAADALGVAPEAIATGTRFEALIAPEGRRSRHAATRNSNGAASPAGSPYRIRFSFVGTAGAAPIWLDDIGRVWTDASGKPLRTRGILSRADAETIADQRLLAPRADDTTPDGMNRQRLFEGLGACLRRAERTNGLCALFLVSVNAVEVVNSRLGYEIGDELIAEVGRVLRSRAHAEGAIYRYASNTLAVIEDLPDVSALEPAGLAIGAVVGDTSLRTSAGPLRATVSVGAVALPAQAATVSEAIAHAMDALEAARREVRGFAAYRPQMTSERTRRRERAISGSVATALDEDRLLLALQPIVDAASGKPVYYEGLLRLRREDGTLESASEFIVEAEQLGVARLVDLRALELGIALLGRHRGLKLSLNVSSLTAGDPSWLARLTGAIAERPDLASRLVIEITETAIIHDLERVCAFVDQVHRLGCRVAIDDFGSGYTSFRFLKALKVDILKIDGQFVSDLPHDEPAQIIVKTMLDMAKALKLETVAEWVSDEASRDVLRAAGATHLQGYLYGRPVLAEELEAQGLL